MTTTTQYVSFDSYIYSYDPNTTHGNENHVDIGRYSSYYARGLLKFDLSGVPYGNSCDSAILSLKLMTDYASSNCNWKVYRVKRNWTETYANWNQYDSGVSWQTAGAGGSNDIDLTELGTSTTISQSSSVGTVIQISLNPTEVQKMYDGTYVDYGFLIKSTELATDYWETYGRTTIISSYRPKLDIYTSPTIDPIANPVIASGGDESIDGDYKIHTFTSSGSFVVENGGYVEVLVVGGGGGGGHGQSIGSTAAGAGGGGAGRLLYNPGFYINSGSTIIVVGSGGLGATVRNTSGSSGTASSFYTINSIGGGGGRGSYSISASGGCGGGGWGSTNNIGGVGQQGMDGGNGGWNYRGGGGGGAGEPGVYASISGSGGRGISFSISGSSIYYAGGGGGGGWLANSYPGAGGLGGGGNGGGSSSGSYLYGSNATSNTGGGGGGGGTNDTTGYQGGNGASGIVIVRYSTTGYQTYDSYTKSLLHFDSTNGSYYFRDEIQNVWTPYVYPSTSGSGPIIKTDQYKFGTASSYFSGSAPGNWLQTPTDFDFNTQDFTIEGQIRPDLSRITSDYNRGLWGYDNISDDANYWGFRLSGSTVETQYFVYQHFVGGSAISNVGGSIMPLEDNVWQHIAFVRQGTIIKGYLKGILKATFTCASSIDMPLGKYFIIGNIGSSGWMRGYLDEFRISVGIARWTSDFTPPSAPYAPIGQSGFLRQPFMYSSYGWI